MAEVFSEVVEVQSAGKWTTIRLDANGAVANLGAGGMPGNLTLHDAENRPSVQLAGGTALGGTATVHVGALNNAGELSVRDDQERDVFKFKAETATMSVGHIGNSGELSLLDLQAREAIKLAASSATVFIGTQGHGGDLIIRDTEAGDHVLVFNSGSALLAIGANGKKGNLNVLDGTGREVFEFDGGNAVLRVGFQDNEGDIILRDANHREVIHLNAGGAALRIGTGGHAGNLSIRDAVDHEVLQFDSENAVMRIGASSNAGDLIVRDRLGREVFHFDGEHSVLRIGTKDNEGDLRILDGEGRQVFEFDASKAVLRVGAQDNEGDIRVRNNAGAEVISLNGATGDILLSNADAAEHFDVADAVQAEPGMLMVLNCEGKLEPSSIAYDKKVVGVVAGAGNYRPGIVLGHRSGVSSRVPISVLGKVYCKVDTSSGPIECGDLLTTSQTSGHAMRASDRERAFGSVLGKALASFSGGTGLIPIFVALQ